MNDLEMYSQNYALNFGTPKFVFKSAKGNIVEDTEGNEYIDLLGGIAVNALGHANDELISAMHLQARKAMHISNFFTSEPQIALATKLLELVNATDSNAGFLKGGGALEGPAARTGFDEVKIVRSTGDSEASATAKNSIGRVLLTNSGTESLEGALKVVKKHAFNAQKPEAKIIALEGAFHGRTLGALSLTHKEKYRAPFEPLLPNVVFIKPNDTKALKNAFKEPVAGMFLECIQGEAGVKALTDTYIQEARALTKKHNALLVIDEVQTGIGRTGSWFAFQNAGVIPDVFTLAKGLGGGFPIGALVMLGEAADILGPGDHGTTFGGNPLASAVALKVLEIIERDYLLNFADQMYEIVSDTVQRFENPYVKEVRGRGLLIAIELTKAKAAQVADKCLELGVIVNAVNPNALRLAPALNIDVITMHRALKIVNQAILAVFEGDEND